MHCSILVKDQDRKPGQPGDSVDPVGKILVSISTFNELSMIVYNFCYYVKQEFNDVINKSFMKVMRLF